MYRKWKEKEGKYRYTCIGIGKKKRFTSLAFSSSYLHVCMCFGLTDEMDSSEIMYTQYREVTKSLLSVKKGSSLSYFEVRCRVISLHNRNRNLIFLGHLMR